MSQNTKYVVSIVSLLFIFTASYSGYVIYQNKHNHTGARFNLINFITGKDSTPSSLKKSSVAQQIAKQNAQYSVDKPNVSPAVETENSQRQVVLSFYAEYLKNKKDGQNQDATLAKYGTNYLAAEYKNPQTGYTDSIICIVDNSMLPSSAAITNIETVNGTTTYALQLSDSKVVVTFSQAKVIGQGSSSRIDSVGCKGPI